MKNKLKLAGVLVFILSYTVAGQASATGTWDVDAHLNRASATDRFDHLGFTYQRHLDKDSYSRVGCDRVAPKSYDCRGLWKATAFSDEDIWTHFTFKATGTVIKSSGRTITTAKFVKWETVDGTTEKTSTVTLKAIERPHD